MKNWIKFIFTMLIGFSFARVIFLIVHNSNIADLSLIDFFYSFLYGIRYDLSVIGYFTLPVLLIFIFALLIEKLFPKITSLFQGFVCYYCIIITVLILMAVFVDFGFYFEFKSRLNYLVFDYLEDYDTIFETVITVYPFNFIFIILLLLILPTIYFLRKKLFLNAETSTHSQIISGKSFILFLILLIVAIRGGIQDEPINWGSSSISRYHFINHLSMNPLWNLGYSFINSTRNNENKKYTRLKIRIPEAQNFIKENLAFPPDNFINPDYPLLRKSNYPPNSKNPNVVIIIMESFNNQNVGILGNKDNLTPNFDEFSKDGVLFSRMFSTGTRTSRALSGILLSFPALPRFKSILTDSQVHQPFSSLAFLLKKRNYSSMFLYAGDSKYDNIYQFFTLQGFEEVRGREFFPTNAFSTKYGVADEYLYEGAKGIIEKSQNPFILTLLNVSNHQPYQIPYHSGTESIYSDNDLNKKQKAFKYADWALGNFLEWYRDRKDYRNTIFVIVGDHGSFDGESNKDLSIDLELFHVPCLIIAPGLEPSINARVASQIDIIPTILPLIGGEFIHHSWGKNLLNNLNQMDYALITPSGLNHVSGLVSKNNFLIYDFQSKNIIYSFTDFENSLELILEEKNTSIKLELEKYITSFLKLSAYSLNNFKCGIPESL